MAKKRPQPDAEGYLQTGIYQRYVGPKHPLPMEQAISEAAAEPDVTGWLDSVKSWAAAILRPHVTGPHKVFALDQPGTCYAADMGDGWGFYYPGEDPPEEVLDAFQLMTEIRVAALHSQPDGNPVYLAAAMQKIGRLQERIQVRPFEPLVTAERGRRRKATETVKELNACYTELHGDYQPNVDKLVADGLSYTNATEEVAAMFNVSARTVQRRTVNKSPRNRGRNGK